MSFEKARNIIDLYTNLCGRFIGFTIDDVIEKYQVSKRTAQRMLHLTEDMFNAETYQDGEGRKRWHVKDNIKKELIDITPDELASLDLAIDLLKKRGQKHTVIELSKLKIKVSALIPSQKKHTISTDHEALLEAQGYAARRGPRPFVNIALFDVLSEAIKACRAIEFEYPNNQDIIKNRLVYPYGVLYGKRIYLVASPNENNIDNLRNYRLDKIISAKLSEEYFERDEQFNLNTYSRKAYSIYQNEKEYGEVEWRFSPVAAHEAKSYLFHPDQHLVEEKDGSLTVTFKASGIVEMCWDLYRWGDKVEVIKPKKLRDMCEGHRRSNFYNID